MNRRNLLALCEVNHNLLLVPYWCDNLSLYYGRVTISLIKQQLIWFVSLKQHIALMSLELRGPLLIQNEGSRQRLPSQELLQTLTEEMRRQWNYSTLFRQENAAVHMYTSFLGTFLFSPLQSRRPVVKSHMELQGHYPQTHYGHTKITGWHLTLPL